MIKIKLLILLNLILISVFAYPQEKQFRQALKENTVLAIDGFIKKYPDSKYTEEAAFRKASLIDKAEAFEDFLSKYPDGYFAPRAKDLLSYYAYKKVIILNKPEEYEKYLKSFPGSDYADTVRKEIEKFDYNLIKNNWNKDSLINYLSNHPNSFFKKEIEKKFIEIRDWDFAVKKDTSLLYAEYLKLYPKGFKMTNAKESLEKALWNDAVKSDWYSVYEIFIKTYPYNIHVKEAKERIEWLKSQKAEYHVEYDSISLAQNSPYQDVGSPFFSTPMKFYETGGKIGYRIKGSGIFIDKNGGRWSEKGSKYIERDVAVEPGKVFYFDYWSSGTVFKGSTLVFTWEGEDAGGHPVDMIVKIKNK